MSALFEELDYRVTPIGPISLRRRRMIGLGLDVFEVKLGEEHLMSSLFTVGEQALATLALAELEGGELDVVVGGLGLGYTAAEVLKDERVRSLRVIELLDAVIEWHEDGLVPLGATLMGDARCTLAQGDFFALAGSETPDFDRASPGRQYHAVLLDIDHSPDWLLHPDNRRFYSPKALTQLSHAILPGGVFAMWSDAGPDQAFLQLLGDVYGVARADVVEFDNPVRGGTSTCTIYVAQKAPYEAAP
jgi:hypothetical protein